MAFRAVAMFAGPGLFTSQILIADEDHRGGQGSAETVTQVIRGWRLRLVS